MKLNEPFKLTNKLIIDNTIELLIQYGSDSDTVLISLFDLLQDVTQLKFNLIYNYLILNYSMINQLQSNLLFYNITLNILIITDVNKQIFLNYIVLNNKNLTLFNNTIELLLNKILLYNYIDLYAHNSNLPNGDFNTYNLNSNTIQYVYAPRLSILELPYFRTAGKFISINGLRYLILNHNYRIMNMKSINLTGNPTINFSMINFKKGNKIRFYIFDNIQYSFNDYILVVIPIHMTTDGSGIVTQILQPYKAYRDQNNSLTFGLNRSNHAGFYQVDLIIMPQLSNHIMRVFTINYEYDIPADYTFKFYVYVNVFANANNNNPPTTYTFRPAFILMA